MTPDRRTFLRQLGFGALGAGIGSWTPHCFADEKAPLDSALPRSTPDAEGVSAAGIVAFLEAIARGQFEMHSFMMMRHGRVIAEGWWSPYAASLRHTMYSMSKSFTSTAVGFAVAEGKLRVEDPVASFFPEDLPAEVGDNLGALRVKHLLTMSVGQEKEPTVEVVKEENWVKAFLAKPITHAPGSVFLYNSTATYMLSAIVQQVTEQKIFDYLTPRLFEPLGITGATWETCPRGINTGGWGLSIQSEGLAKFGQLYLKKGQWKGQQLLPAEWVEEATTFKIQQPESPSATRPKKQNDWLQGYCYQFWRCQHNAFRGDGAFGQFTIVMPDQDAVIVMTGENSNMQGELDLVWEHLLPAMKKSSPGDAAARTRLPQMLSALALDLPKAHPTPATAARVTGKKFQLEQNPMGLTSVIWDFTPADSIFVAQAGVVEHRIACGMPGWRTGETLLPGTPPRLLSGGAPKEPVKSKIAAAGAWKDEQTFVMIIRYIETPHHDTITCHFDGDQVKASIVSSVIARTSKPGESRRELVGKMS